MHKYLRVNDGDYTIQVQTGGRITLDTGVSNGEVLVTGNLRVNGTTTTINSTDMSIDDNIIIINDGETGSSISLGTAGIRIDRGERDGSGLDAYFLFDESLNNTATGQTGLFSFSVNSVLRGIATNSINSAGGDLYLINESTGVLNVTGTTNYEEQVFTYVAGAIDISGGLQGNGIINDDAIPNAKALVDYIEESFATTLLTQIGDGVIDVTRVRILDNESTGQPSRIEFTVDNQIVGEWYQNRLELESVRIEGTRIETTASNADLILSAPGTGNVVVDDTLNLRGVFSQPEPDNIDLQPTAPFDGIKLYARTEATGGTGLFFVNSDTRRDEIISNNRSLIYSMIF